VRIRSTLTSVSTPRGHEADVYRPTPKVQRSFSFFFFSVSMNKKRDKASEMTKRGRKETSKKYTWTLIALNNLLSFLFRSGENITHLFLCIQSIYPALISIRYISSAMSSLGGGSLFLRLCAMAFLLASIRILKR